MPNGWGGKLKVIRKEEGITQSELAKLSKVSGATISRIESGKSHGTEMTKQKIVEALNKISEGKKYDIEDIFPEE